MEARRWIRTVLVWVGLAATLGAGHHYSGTVILGGSSSQRAMARWALDRFAAEGLALPPLEIRFQAKESACGGYLGSYADGTATVCGARATRMTRRTLLHEVAHAWTNSRLSREEEVRFLEFRGLRTWNADGVPWEERGFEQAAEVMSWALCDQGSGYLRPFIPNNAVEQLTDSYELLTGKPLPKLGSQRVQ
jgi:hypothetical protein